LATRLCGYIPRFALCFSFTDCCPTFLSLSLLRLASAPSLSFLSLSLSPMKNLRFHYLTGRWWLSFTVWWWWWFLLAGDRWLERAYGGLHQPGCYRWLLPAAWRRLHGGGVPAVIRWSLCLRNPLGFSYAALSAAVAYSHSLSSSLLKTL
jgi:hypothetical protein